MNDYVIVLEDVLAWPPARVLRWLERNNPQSTGLNWPVLAFSAAARAGEEPSLDWARVAWRVYGALIARSSPRQAFSYSISMMNVCANMIATFGVDAMDELRNPDTIARWTLGLVPMAIEAAAALSPAEWAKTPPAELLRLRDMKNALNVLSRVADDAVLARFPGLKPWLDLREALP
jgi:hypothetical protein